MLKTNDATVLHFKEKTFEGDDAHRMKVGELVSILLWVPIPDPALHFKHESNETLNPIDRRIERGICDHCQWKKCMDGYTGRMMV